MRAQVAASQVSAMPHWQQNAGSAMEFEVASIRPGDPNKFIPPNFALDTGDGPVPPGGRFSADFPLSVYITFAYKLWLTREQMDAMLAHQPKWVATDPFVIEARAPGNPTKDQMRLMVRSLIADRFKLVVHMESQDVPVFAMVLAKPGQLGPKLLQHDKGPPCDAPMQPTQGGSTAMAPNVFPAGCELYAMMTRDHTILLGSRNTTMAQVGDALPGPGRLGRPVVDQTGLGGKFDFTLQWTPESDSPQANGTDAQLDLAGPSFLEALKDQLGLKLRPTKAPVRILVIDHVERPTEN